MKIAVNTRFLLPDKLEGLGKFTFEILKRMTVNHPEHEFIFFFDRPFDECFIFSDNVTPVVLMPPARHPFLWYIWFEISIARAIKKYQPDVFLSTDGYTSLSAQVKKVTVMHDLAFEHFPQDSGFLVRKFMRYYSPKYAQNSDRLIAVSEFTKQDIVKTYAQPAAKIDVVYNDASPFFKPVSEKEQKNTRTQYSKGEEYFLFVGAIHPRKNLVNLFLAFDEFKKKTLSPVKLLIVGRPGWNNKKIYATYQNLKYRNEVLFTGRVSDEELVGLYGAALATVYVPYLEGFGIPIVEAQKCNCPVITSDVTSMPEVAGEGALLADPFSVDDIATAMMDMYHNPDLRNDLIRLGQENLKRFSWDRSAEQVMESIRKVVPES